MFAIKCSFEKDSGTDAVDPLGDIELADDHSTILISKTYLDSWLDAMVGAINQIRVGAGFQISVPEEPEPLHLSIGTDERITIRFANKVVVANDRGEFEKALRDACTTFLRGVGSQDKSSRNPAIQRVRMFYESTANDW